MKISLLPSLLFFAAGLFYSTESAEGSLIYSANFTPDGVGFTHSNSTPPLAPPQSASTSNFTLSYASTPATDSTTNEFITTGGTVEVQDWGGVGRGNSSVIDVSGVDSVDISLLASSFGGGANVGAEYFQWFYQLDGGSEVQQTYTGSASFPTLLNHTFNSINTSAASSLTVGFNFNLDGANTGFIINSMSVSAIPEPTTIIALSMMVFGLGGILVIRKRPSPATP